MDLESGSGMDFESGSGMDLGTDFGWWWF